MSSYEMKQAELVEAIRAHLAARGIDASEADVQFHPVGEPHMDGINLRVRVCGTLGLATPTAIAADRKFLLAVREYIEGAEEGTDAEFGCCRSREQLIAAGEMPELHAEVLRRLEATGLNTTEGGA